MTLVPKTGLLPFLHRFLYYTTRNATWYQMLAVLNSVVLSLMDLHQVANVARQRRRFASHPHEALAWVLDF